MLGFDLAGLSSEIDRWRYVDDGCEPDILDSHILIARHGAQRWDTCGDITLLRSHR